LKHIIVKSKAEWTGNGECIYSSKATVC